MICDTTAALVTAVGRRGIDAQVQAAVEAAIEPLNAQLNKLAGMVESAELAAKACRREVEDMAKRQRMPYVYRLTVRNRTYLVVAVGYALVPPRIWRTHCGRNYGSAGFKVCLGPGRHPSIGAVQTLPPSASLRWAWYTD